MGSDKGKVPGKIKYIPDTKRQEIMIRMRCIEAATRSVPVGKYAEESRDAVLNTAKAYETYVMGATAKDGFEHVNMPESEKVGLSLMGAIPFPCQYCGGWHTGDARCPALCRGPIS
jgi:hypothetical protein